MSAVLREIPSSFVARGMSARSALVLLLAAGTAVTIAETVAAPHAFAQQTADSAPMKRGETWDDAVALERVARAIDRRGVQLADSSLVDYQATARGFLAFLAQLGEDFADPPRVVQTEQLALRVSWWQPGRSAQQLVGRRDTTLMPASVGYYRDRYGVVLDNLPDRIRLGDGFDVADVPHPLAQGADTLYEYRRGESFSMRLPDRSIVVQEVQFRPRDPSKARAVGSVYLDIETSAVVRLQLTFTRSAILDRRIETLVVTLENSLVRGRYWLPRRQEVEVVRRSTWMDVPARGIVRGHWEVSQYTVNEGVDALTLILPKWSSLSRDSLEKWAFEGEVVNVLPPDMLVARDADVRDAQLRAETALRSAALSRPMTLAAAGRGVSDAVRYSRAEGLGLGFGLAHRWPQAITLSGRLRYGVDDVSAKGRVSLDKRPALGGAPIIELFAERQYRELGTPERAGVTNSFASLFFGSDYTSPVDLRAIGMHWRPGNARHWSLRAAYEDERALELVARPLSGAFAPIKPAWSLKGVRADVARTGRFGETGFRNGSWTWRAIGSSASGRDERDVVVRPLALRLEADAFMQWPLSNGGVIVASTLLGTSIGGGLPPQWLQYAGGPRSGPGYGFHDFVGRSMASPHLEWRIPVPFPSLPLGKYGASPSRILLAPFAHAVLLHGAHPDASVSRYQNGVYPAIGVGALLFYDLLRVDVSRGLHRGSWRFAIDVDRAFWGIL